MVLNGVLWNTAKRMCSIRYENSPEGYKTYARMVLDYCPAECFEATGSAQGELGFIHLVRSPWLAEKLLCRGADPNLRTPLNHGNSPALVHHLFNGSPAVALDLLRQGVDPEAADINGVNAIHAALAHSYKDVLQAIHEVLKLLRHASWHATCTRRYGNIAYPHLIDLELSVL